MDIKNRIKAKELGLMTSEEKKAEKANKDLSKSQNKMVSDLKKAGKEFEEFRGIAKTVAIAQTTYDTYQAAQAAYKSMAGIPVVGPALGAIAAAAAVAMGLQNIKAIESASASGGGSGGGVSAPATATPRTEIQSGAFTLEGGTEPEPARAYVVSDDITNSQNKLANIRRRATI